MGFLVENRIADEAVRRNVGAGYHYFDKDTMRGFGSRVHEGYDLGNGDTLVIMSNKDRGMFWDGQHVAVLGGRRHYYYVVVRADGSTSKELPEPFRYDVSKKAGYWFSLRSARAAVKRLREALRAE